MYGMVALVHIVIFKFGLVKQQVSPSDRIFTGKVFQFCQYDSLHREIKRLFRPIALYGCHLLELTQHPGVVSHLDGKHHVTIHLFGVFHYGTATVGFDALDNEFALTLIAEFERSGNGLHKSRTTGIDGGFRNRQPLSSGSEQRAVNSE